MRHKVIIALILIGSLFLIPVVGGAESMEGAAQDELVLAAGSGDEEAGFTFIDFSMIVMTVLVTIYFAAVYVREWRQVK